ncbi:FHA domain-containing protein [Sorangium sp. So ce131]|uniref:FHA domain-containing protein n=1 Tax=Sorangium sp. So ce131 TaxID=3133282 RepID=UPI003F5EDBE7
MDTGERIALRSRMLIGRSAACDLRVEDPRVSSEHAGLGWTGAGWEVRDLGSKNGTFVGERRLAVGERTPLLPGDLLTLGAPRPPATAFVLADAEAPAASARQAQTGVVRAASAGLIVLPDDENPRASVVEQHDGSWAVEAQGTARLASDRETVVVDGEAWILDLPQRSSSTVEGGGGGAPTLSTIALRFAVSRNEERVHITVVCPDRDIELPARSHHYLLVTLARARLAAAAEPPAQRGWLDRDELCRMLAIDELRLNVEVCRARKQFSALGIQGAASIVDRRMGTGRIRLGVERVDVRQM